MSNKRYSPDIRRELVLKAAVAVVSKPGGWARLTREAIAKEAECSDGLVSRYLGDMPAARKAIMRYAIKHEILEIIVQSVAAHDGYAVRKWLPSELKQRAIASLLG
jgi:AcrR family transcriptional regulator